jgi:hypothetical protein
MGTLIATLLPLITPFIANGIVALENIFKGKPKSGTTDKFPTLLASVTAFITGLAKSGLAPGVPAESEIATVIQTVFDDLNSKKIVNSPDTPIITPYAGKRTLLAVTGDVKVIGEI